ncbi:MAG: hypothetical protein KDK91_23280 [Gammaproteobacteria bacterium]|nr:hypothetical protein [Gammaproteobacteria bacterium]
MLLAIPFLAFVVLAYAALTVIVGVDVSVPAFSLPMPSGAALRLDTGDLIVFAGLFVMFFEIAKSTRTGAASVIDHILSVVLFVLCLLMLILWAPFGTATFLLITVMCLIDVIAGFTVSIISARRDVGIDSMH